MTALVLALLGPVVSAVPAICWCLRGCVVRFQWLIVATLAMGTGLGLASCTFFLWLMAFDRLRVSLLAFELPIFAVIAAIFTFALWRGRDPLLPPPTRTDERNTGGGQRMVIGAVAITLLFGASGFVLTLRASPHGDFDAFAIWNLRARFLHRAGPDRWRDGFTGEIPWTHPDYPLLVPGLVARSWYYTGDETTLAPRLIALLFTFGSAGLLGGAVGAMRSPIQGGLAAAVLFASPQFLNIGSAQYADVPLACSILSVIVLLVLEQRADRDRWRLIGLAALFASLAAWTKNEGILCMATWLMVQTVALMRRGGRRAVWKGLGVALMASAPVLVCLVYFKTQVAPSNDLVAGLSLRGIVEQVSDGGRYLLIMKKYAQELITTGRGVTIVLACYGLLMGWRASPGVGQSITMIAALVAGYFLAHLTSYWSDLSAHLNYSVDRLFVQLYPAGLFAFFLVVRTPDEVLVPSDGRKDNASTIAGLPKARDTG
jgi:hypothetical protein